jgi:hypothetical protein
VAAHQKAPGASLVAAHQKAPGASLVAAHQKAPGASLVAAAESAGASSRGLAPGGFLETACAWQLSERDSRCPSPARR